MAKLSDYLSRHMGLYFPEKRWNELWHKMSLAMRDFNFDQVERFIDWLMSAPLTRQQVETLASHLTVRETYFFRETNTFELLEKTILPELIRSRQKNEKRLRIWSAGCSTGEEAYSIAILLTRLIPDIKDWNITILATDINPQTLQKAQEGIYSEWSFRGTPQWVKDNYFNKSNSGHYEIRPSFKDLVHLSYLNLMEDVYPALPNNTNAMDLILCRNVLMYFSPDRAKSVTNRFYQCLIEEGFLIVGVVEVSALYFSSFTPVHLRNMTFYRKGGLVVKSSRKFQADFLKEPLPVLSKAAAGKRSKPSPSSSRKQLAGPAAIQSQQAAHEKALDWYNQGRYSQAESELAGDLRDLKSMILLARTLANQGKLTDALHWCEKALSIEKLHSGCHYLYASILEEQGRFDEAVMALNKARYLDPDFVLAHFSLGNLMQRLGRPEERKRYFRNTAELLSKYKPEEIIPESGGITAGRLAEILVATNH